MYKESNKRLKEKQRETICESFVFFIKTIKHKAREDEKKIR
jgi:hypothetical protein